ncbi:MAG: hypothetical protein P8R54_21840 [Myxococcota bacterium]|nr:hypothetical protein [Myxococcota bacterium]
MPRLPLILPLSLTLLACGDKDTTATTSTDDTDTVTTGDDTATGQDDTGTPPPPVVMMGVSGVVVLEGNFNVASARVWASENPDDVVRSNVWGEFQIDVDERESQLCFGLLAGEGTVCEDIRVGGVDTNDQYQLNPADFDGLVLGHVSDTDGAGLVHRGLVSQDVIVSLQDSTGATSGTGITNISGWFALQGSGTVTVKVEGTSMSAEAPTDSQPLSLTIENSAPRFTGPPVIFNGTDYFRVGESLTVSTEGVVEDPDGDDITITTTWSADNMGTVMASDGRGGVAMAPVQLQDSESVYLYGELEPGSSVGLCDGTSVEVDESGRWEAVVKTSAARCAVSFNRRGMRWSHVVYAHGDSTLVNPDMPDWDETVTFKAESGTELVTAGKEIQLTIPEGAIVDASGKEVTGEVSLSYALIDMESGLPGEPVAYGKEGTSLAEPLKAVALSLVDADGKELQISSDKASLQVLLDADDVTGREQVRLLSLTSDDGSWEDEGADHPMSGDYAVVPASGLANALFVVADLAQEFGCIRVYIADHMVKGTPHLSMITNKAAFLVPISGPVTIIGPGSLSTSTELWLHDGNFNIVEQVVVPSSLLNSLSTWPEPVPYQRCTDVTLPTAQPAGEYLTRKLVEEAQLPTGFDGGDVAEAYYDAIDPLGEATTFEDWVSSLSWPDKYDTNGNFDPRRSGGDDAFAIYGNDGDLGFGREMHMWEWSDWDPNQTGEDPIIAMYTTNYLTVGAAAAGLGVVATVAMEFRPHPVNGGAHYTRFFAFDSSGARIGELPLDDFGVKAMPDLCTNCHGGEPAAESQLTVSGSSLVYPDDGRMADAFGRAPRFIPFSVETFGYTPGYNLSSQQAAFKTLNEVLFETNISTDVHDMITGWYADGTGIQDTEWMPPGWATHPTNPSVDSEAFYSDIVQPYCRSCHLSFNSSLDFTETMEVMGMGSYLDFLMCDAPTQMPQAQVTQGNFYNDIDAKLTFIREMQESEGTNWTATECPH